MTRGRKPGFKHSIKTKEKQRQANLGKKHTDETKQKIGLGVKQGLSGQIKSEEHKESLSEALSPSQEELAYPRYQELLETYPQHTDFITKNKQKLLIALQDVRSERELFHISHYIESDNIDRYRNKLCYDYPTSSYQAQEDIMIECLDFVRSLERLDTVKQTSFN